MNGPHPAITAPTPPYSTHYLGFFGCFNEGRFYEAHDILEHLWLQKKSAPEANYYKALIQLAGAFVHYTKNRPNPAHRLLGRAAYHLEPYPDLYCGLHLPTLLKQIETWQTSAAQTTTPQLPLPNLEPTFT